MRSDQTLRARLLLINCPVHERVSMDQERKRGERERMCVKEIEIKDLKVQKIVSVLNIIFCLSHILS
jgi:hypothetical protein